MANFKSAILTTGSLTKSGTSEVEIVAPVDVKNEDRISFQFYNANGPPSNTDTGKVYGRLAATSGSLGAAAEWTQIGDDVVISGSSSALKAISTTGLYWVGVTVTPTAGSSTITHAMLRQA